MGYVIIENLDCYGRHGVLKEENVLGQRFFVSCRMKTSFENASCDDDINNAVNYAEVSQFIVAFVGDNIFKLIETLADKLCDELLKRFAIEEVQIRIDKPSAPIGLPLKTVAVELCKKWSTAYLSIGSNIGDKKAYLDNAVKELKNDSNIRVKNVATYIETAPYGYKEQDSFLNSCVEIDTIYSPEKLLKTINEIEQKADRKREIHWGPRTLDIDIVLYEDVIMHTKDLTIPHIDMENRLFVLEPLCEIAPYATNPVNKKSAREMYMLLK